LKGFKYNSNISLVVERQGQKQSQEFTLQLAAERPNRLAFVVEATPQNGATIISDGKELTVYIKGLKKYGVDGYHDRWYANYTQYYDMPERYVQRGSLVETRTAGVAVVHPDLANLELHPPTLLAFEASEVVGQLVAGDSAQPGHDIGASVEARPLVDRRDERLLAELLRQRDIVRATAEQVRVHARERPPVPGLEGGVIRERQLELGDAFDGAGASGHVPRVSFGPRLAYE